MNTTQESPINVVLMRQLLRSARKTLPYFGGHRAKDTIRWFMYGIKPGELPPPSGKTVTWRRISEARPTCDEC